MFYQYSGGKHLNLTLESMALKQLSINTGQYFKYIDTHVIWCNIEFIFFRCLHKSGGDLQLDISTTCAVIMACGVLHNMAIRAGLPDPEIEDDCEEDNHEDSSDEEEGPQRGADLRQLIANRL